MPRLQSVRRSVLLLTIVHLLGLTIAISGCGRGGGSSGSEGTPGKSGVTSDGSGGSGSLSASKANGGSGTAVDSNGTGGATGGDSTVGDDGSPGTAPAREASGGAQGGAAGGRADPSGPPVASPVNTQDPPVAESSFIYALHALSDAGAAGKQLLSSGNAGGYVVYPFSAKQFKATNSEMGWQTGSPVPAGCTLIARLNWSYTPDGTIPAVGQSGDAFSSYEEYADLLAAQARKIDAKIFIIGNEINLQGEWPVRAGTPVPITVADYVSCYKACYAAIKAARPDARVIPSPLAPGDEGDAERGIPNFMEYWRQMLREIPQAQVEGLCLHAYTHSYNDTDAGVTTNFAADAETATTPDGATYFKGFRVYESMLAQVPEGERDLPAYITECCAICPPNHFWQTSFAWPDRREPWVHNIYAQIKAWNLLPSTQKIRCVALFCYEQHFKQQYGITSFDFGLASSPGAVADLMAEMRGRTTWH